MGQSRTRADRKETTSRCWLEKFSVDPFKHQDVLERLSEEVPAWEGSHQVYITWTFGMDAGEWEGSHSKLRMRRNL
jgi:hypothetical protein